MGSLRGRLVIATLIVVSAVVAAACTDASRPSSRAPSVAPSPTSLAAASPMPKVTDRPAPTAVPGGQAVSPGPRATHRPTTTKTDWGVILDAVPDDFPRYPGAEDADSPDGPASATLIAAAGVDKVATWYRDALDAAGYATLDLSDALEDGSRVLNSQADVPECRVQTTFRPADGSTMITVLFAAGCAAIGG